MKKLTVLAALGVAAISSAQGNLLEEPTNIAFRLGYVYPVDATMRNISPSYLGIGIDIYPEGFNLMSEGESYISIDWFGKSGSGAKGNAFPVMINNKVYSDSGYGRSYFFYGLGVVFGAVEHGVGRGVDGDPHGTSLAGPPPGPKNPPSGRACMWK